MAYGATDVKVQWRQWRGAWTCGASLFCEVRDRVDHPLCEFYASALRRLMRLFELEAEVVDRCRATGATQCAMSLVVRPDGNAGHVMTAAVTPGRPRAAAVIT